MAQPEAVGRGGGGGDRLLLLFMLGSIIWAWVCVTTALQGLDSMEDGSKALRKYERDHPRRRVRVPQLVTEEEMERRRGSAVYQGEGVLPWINPHLVERPKLSAAQTVDQATTAVHARVRQWMEEDAPRNEISAAIEGDSPNLRRLTELQAHVQETVQGVHLLPDIAPELLEYRGVDLDAFDAMLASLDKTAVVDKTMTDGVVLEHRDDLPEDDLAAHHSLHHDTDAAVGGDTASGESAGVLGGNAFAAQLERFRAASSYRAPAWGGGWVDALGQEFGALGYGAASEGSPASVLLAVGRGCAATTAQLSFCSRFFAHTRREAGSSAGPTSSYAAEGMLGWISPTPLLTNTSLFDARLGSLFSDGEARKAAATLDPRKFVRPVYRLWLREDRAALKAHAAAATKGTARAYELRTLDSGDAASELSVPQLKSKLAATLKQQIAAASDSAAPRIAVRMYSNDPFLWEERKVALRIFVLLLDPPSGGGAHVGPRAVVHEGGIMVVRAFEKFARFSSGKYKRGAHFPTAMLGDGLERGSQQPTTTGAGVPSLHSLDALETYLAGQGKVQRGYVRQELLPALKRAVAATVLGLAAGGERAASAQLACFDFELDASLRVWLDHVGTGCAVPAATQGSDGEGAAQKLARTAVQA